MTDIDVAAGAPEPAAPAPQPSEAPAKPSAKEPTSRQAIERAFAKVSETAPERKQGMGGDGHQEHVPPRPEPEEIKAEEKPKPETRKQPDAPKDDQKEKPGTVAKDGERARGEDGRFTARDGDAKKDAPTDQGHGPEGVVKGEEKPGERPDGSSPTGSSPPQRFKREAQEAWNDTPEVVRGEITRMQTELEAGITKYKQASDRYSQIEQLDNWVRDNYSPENGGNRLENILTNYINFDRLIRSDPERGLDMLFETIGQQVQGFDKVDWAERILTQAIEAAGGEGGNPQPQPAADPRIDQLMNMVETLVQDRNTERQTQQQQALDQTRNAFAEGHPQFFQVEATMNKLMQAGIATELEDAYNKAIQLDGIQPASQAPRPSEPAAGDPFWTDEPVAPKDHSAQTEAGSKSISGAPSSGSNPEKRKPSSSAREALQRAMRQVGS